MNCSWDWLNSYHMGGQLFWLVPVTIIIVILFFGMRKQKSAKKHMGCLTCGGSIIPAYFRCPHCGTILKSHCPDCSRIVENTWHYCPDCRADLKQSKKG